MSTDDMQRFQIDGLGNEVYGAVILRHRECPSRWWAEIPTAGYDDQGRHEPIPLPELVQRAEEHTEVCR